MAVGPTSWLASFCVEVSICNPLNHLSLLILSTLSQNCDKTGNTLVAALANHGVKNRPQVVNLRCSSASVATPQNVVSRRRDLPPLRLECWLSALDPPLQGRHGPLIMAEMAKPCNPCLCRPGNWAHRDIPRFVCDQRPDNPKKHNCPKRNRDAPDHPFFGGRCHVRLTQRSATGASHRERP
jgi:hypothetical protein